MSENLETLQEVDLLLAQMHDEASESVEKAYGDFLLALEEFTYGEWAEDALRSSGIAGHFARPEAPDA